MLAFVRYCRSYGSQLSPMLLHLSNRALNVLHKRCIITASLSTFFNNKQFAINKKSWTVNKSQLQLNLIAAACDDMGIGINGNLPWRLKNEMAYFTSMTTDTKDINKKNVVLMGRRTWECIPKKYRPLQGRINIVLSSQLRDYRGEAIVCKSIPDALETISKKPLSDQVEKIWVIGGSSVYEAAMESPNFHRLYLTRVKKHFKCDTFFPDIPSDLVLVKDPNVPEGMQVENDIQYEYEVYERRT